MAKPSSTPSAKEVDFRKLSQRQKKEKEELKQQCTEEKKRLAEKHRREHQQLLEHHEQPSKDSQPQADQAAPSLPGSSGDVSRQSAECKLASPASLPPGQKIDVKGEQQGTRIKAKPKDDKQANCPVQGRNVQVIDLISDDEEDQYGGGMDTATYQAKGSSASPGSSGSPILIDDDVVEMIAIQKKPGVLSQPRKRDTSSGSMQDDGDHKSFEDVVQDVAAANEMELLENDSRPTKPEASASLRSHCQSTEKHDPLIKSFNGDTTVTAAGAPHTASLEPESPSSEVNLAPLTATRSLEGGSTHKKPHSSNSSNLKYGQQLNTSSKRSKGLPGVATSAIPSKRTKTTCPPPPTLQVASKPASHRNEVKEFNLSDDSESEVEWSSPSIQSPTTATKGAAKQAPGLKTAVRAKNKYGLKNIPQKRTARFGTPPPSKGKAAESRTPPPAPKKRKVAIGAPPCPVPPIRLVPVSALPKKPIKAPKPGGPGSHSLFERNVRRAEAALKPGGPVPHAPSERHGRRAKAAALDKIQVVTSRTEEFLREEQTRKTNEKDTPPITPGCLNAGMRGMSIEHKTTTPGLGRKEHAGQGAVKEEHDKPGVSRKAAWWKDRFGGDRYIAKTQGWTGQREGSGEEVDSDLARWRMVNGRIAEILD